MTLQRELDIDIERESELAEGERQTNKVDINISRPKVNSRSISNLIHLPLLSIYNLSLKISLLPKYSPSVDHSPASLSPSLSSFILFLSSLKQ